MSASIISSIPKIYKHLLPEIFFADLPKETLATCHDCIMCKDWESKKARDEKYFTPKGKCCTYYPSIPNYLVGSVLEDTSSEIKEGAQRVRSIIDKRVGISPFFLKAPVLYNKKYSAFARLNFGRSRDLICPLHDQSNGMCTIWQHRNSVCSQWYCKSVGEKDGLAFWTTSSKYLSFVEQLLATYAASSLEVPLPGNWSEVLNADDLNGNVDSNKYSEIWNQWENREVQFYKEAYRLINDLSKQRFEELFSKRLEPLHADILEKKILFEKASNR